MNRKKIHCIPTRLTFKNIKIPVAPKYVLTMQLDDNEPIIATRQPYENDLTRYEDFPLRDIVAGLFRGNNISYEDGEADYVSSYPKLAQPIVQAYPEILLMEHGGLSILSNGGGGIHLLAFYYSDSDGSYIAHNYDYFTIRGALGANLTIQDGSSGYWKEPHTVKLHKTINPDGVDIYPYLAVNDEEELTVHLCGLGINQGV